MVEEDFKIEKTKKRTKKLFREIENDVSMAEVRKLKKKLKFRFFYERQGFTNDISRTYRQDLAKIIYKKYKNERVKKIPEEFELDLYIGKSRSFSRKYLIVFANKEELLYIDPKIKFDPKHFEWLKEEQEFGIVDND